MPRIAKPSKIEVQDVPAVEDYLPAEPQEEIVEPMARLGGIAQAMAGPSIQISIEIHKTDEDGTDVTIKTPYHSLNPRKAIAFICRHTGYDPFA